MELKEFIVETISAIADATDDLQKKYEEQGVLINPPLTKDNDHRFKVDDRTATYRYVSDIEFDVALTISAESNKEGKAGLKVFAAEIGGGAGASNATEQVSRVQFAIPITLGPTQAEGRNRQLEEEQQRRNQAAMKKRRASQKDGF